MFAPHSKQNPSEACKVPSKTHNDMAAAARVVGVVHVFGVLLDEGPSVVGCIRGRRRLHGNHLLLLNVGRRHIHWRVSIWLYLLLLLLLPVLLFTAVALPANRHRRCVIRVLVRLQRVRRVSTADSVAIRVIEVGHEAQR